MEYNLKNCWVIPHYLWGFCCCCSVAQLHLTLCNPMNCSMPGFPVLHCLLEFAQTHIHWVDYATQSSQPLLPQSFPASGSFPMRWHCIRCQKYWSFSFSISPCNQYSELISFRIEWFDLFAVKGTLKSLLQHHNLKAFILQHSGLFMVHFRQVI